MGRTIEAEFHPFSATPAATDVSTFSHPVRAEIEMERSPPTASACAPKQRIPDPSGIQGVGKTHAAILPLASRRNERVRSACTEAYRSRIGYGCRRMQHWSVAPPDPPWGSKRRIIQQRGRVLPHLRTPSRYTWRRSRRDARHYNQYEIKRKRASTLTA